MEKASHPTPVPPKATGEGLPYAPIDFPNPGDIWTWKVGSQISRSGYYTRRFLIVPERLRKTPFQKIWFGSKTSLKTYIQSSFPGADLDRFFSSFTWDVPAETRSKTKDKNQPSRRTRSLKEFYSESPKTRSSARKSMQFAADLESDILDDIASTSLRKKDAVQSDLNPMNQGSRSLANYLTQMTTDDFKFYLNYLDNIRKYHVPQATNPEKNRLKTDNLTKPRNKLSSLLSSNFPTLIRSDKLSEITDLSSKLQFDLYLTPQEISILNLIQEIPSARKDFLEARRVTLEATNFFSKLEELKSLVEEHKNKCSQIALLQTEGTSMLNIIHELDEQIAVLKSRRSMLVNEFHMENSESSLWELKQIEAAKKEVEILARFSPLQGFSFLH